ncbi:MAG TPA: helix-turn-helix transcriptional regulator [Tepidisphaeraceae bacterium]|nr:helix-turn-helix transcriptional regulator [Tepidisphaeraceae bacterium]
MESNFVKSVICLALIAILGMLKAMAKKPNPPSSHDVPGILRQVREEASLTQRDLAKRMKRAQPWIHKSEIGERRVDVSEFVDWCAGCRIDPHEVLRRLTSSSK